MDQNQRSDRGGRREGSANGAAAQGLALMGPNAILFFYLFFDQNQRSDRGHRASNPRGRGAPKRCFGGRGRTDRAAQPQPTLQQVTMTLTTSSEDEGGEPGEAAESVIMTTQKKKRNSCHVQASSL